MKSNLLKYFSILFTLTLTLSCGGGGGDDGGNGSGGSGSGGGTSNPPGKATLVAPANNKACETGTSISLTQTQVTFTWTASAKTSSYNLKITNLNTNATALDKSGITSITTKENLEKGIPYSWNITSKNNSTTTTTSSDTWKFYLEGPGIVNYAPFPANLIEPNESVVNRNSNGRVTFTWEGSDPDTQDTLAFTLYVDKVDGKQTPPSSQSNLSVKTLDVALDGGVTYYCRVKTSDGTNSSYSTIYSFLTK